MLNQSQLAHANFPLGRMTKEEVSQIAEANKLVPVSGHESQDICFVKNQHYSKFLDEHGGLKPVPGEIVDVHGKYLGKHKGLHRYTIGQRRGINSPSTEPYYVIRLDTDNNRLIVGSKKDLYRHECKIYQINWIPYKPKKSVRVMTKIRYRHDPADSEIFPTSEDTATIRFSHPQPAVTPGQAAVCYHGDRVIAGGWIYE
jgi:tRNA-specific 2-thiouridylase